VPPTAKRFEYAIALDRTGTLTAEGEGAVDLAEAWTPDHLLLAALATCTIEALRFHARRSDVRVDAAAEAWGAVTKSGDDGRYRFVEIRCELDVALDPEPGADDLKELIFRAERDCFVGASLTVKPVYQWQVNGTDIALGEADVTAPAEPSSDPGP
jgi:organic hydroperoxide reductase OsmC/OhrA